MFTDIAEANWSLIPLYMQDGLRRWIMDGIRPGGFLCAVLENNLKESFMRADMTNKRCIDSYVEFLYTYAPSGCWGSKEKLASWEAVKGLNGYIKANEEKALSHN
jgi:hypothetical protein